MFISLLQYPKALSQYSFPKSEKLTSVKLFDKLFESGNAINKFPFKLLWIKIIPEKKTPVKVAFAVSSRKIKSAVKRNRMKRLMRESYRLNKQQLIDVCNKKPTGIAMVFLYNGNELIPYSETREKIILLLHRLISLHELAE